jgi:hypothetical protein
MRAAALALCLIGCAPSLPASYHCTTDAQCHFGGQQGHCEASAACSFPDAGCASGSRYGQFAPPGLAGACVDVANNDLGSGGGGGGGGGGGDGGTGVTHIMRIGSTIVSRANRTAVTLSSVNGTMPGDFVLACVLVASSTVAVTPPAGWTIHQMLSENAAGNYGVVYLQHVAAAGDPSSFTFGLSASTNVTAAAVDYRNVDPTTPIDAAANAKFQGTQFVAPSITTTHANDFLVTMFVQSMSSTLGWVPPTGMEVAVSAGDIGFFDVEQPAAGATGTKTASFNIGAVPGVGAVDFVALTPKP